MSKKTIPWLLALTVTVLHLVMPTSSHGESSSSDELLAAARSTLASQIETGLPDQPIESWLAALVSDNASLTWELNDCGEQTGNPEIDAARDLPICAEIAASHVNQRIFLYFFVGTKSMGVVDDSRGLYFVGISRGASFTHFDSLRSLAIHLRNDQIEAPDNTPR